MRKITVVIVFLTLTVFGTSGFLKAEETALAVRESVLFQEKDFSALMGMEGFSDEMISDHLKLYSGYVKNSNKLSVILSGLLAEGKSDTPEYAELKRRLGWEINGMRLHEYYFENLGGDREIDAESDLYAKISQDFGSFDKWKDDFVATGAMRGIGWVILYREPGTNKLINAWIEEHDKGNFAGWEPILVMDVFEHAYMTDYRLNRGEYIKAFFANIDWRSAEKRFQEG
jgi:superoxide dismutase, Fe-Mn family